MFLIVSLDGGGVRGALQVVLLGRLFARFPWLEQYVKMYAGSSVGGILAAALATRSFAEAQRLATPEAFATVFTQTWAQEIRSVDGWYAAQFSNAPLKRLLESTFGESSRLRRRQVCAHHCILHRTAPRIARLCQLYIAGQRRLEAASLSQFERRMHKNRNSRRKRSRKHWWLRTSVPFHNNDEHQQ
jgi:predicted acylesterase/phospholipase RssA